MKLGPGMRFIDEEMGGQMLEGGGGGGQSMTWEELCDDDVDVWFAHASHS